MCSQRMSFAPDTLRRRAASLRQLARFTSDAQALKAIAEEADKLEREADAMDQGNADDGDEDRKQVEA